MCMAKSLPLDSCSNPFIPPMGYHQFLLHQIPLYDLIIIWNSFLSHMLSPISFYFFHQSHSNFFSPITVYILLLYILMHSSSFHPNIIISFIIHVSADRSPSHLIETTPFPQHSYHVQLSQATLESLSNKYQ